VQSGYAVVLRFSDGYAATIENTVRLEGSIDGGPGWSASPPLDELVGDTVRTADVRGTGELAITFDSGRELVVGVDAEYEAWNVTGPDGLLVVCLPGGGLAVWGVPEYGRDGADASRPRVHIDDTDSPDGFGFDHEGRPVTGEVVDTDRTGNVNDVTPVVRGVPHGVQRAWYPDGTLRLAIPLFNGVARGTSRRWYPNGRLAEERDIDDRGGLVAIRRWDESGSPIE
jgi:hypothetical protein